MIAKTFANQIARALNRATPSDEDSDSDNLKRDRRG